MKKVMAGIVALLFVALLGYRAEAGRSDWQVQAQDRAQIEKLMWQYVRALDTENADAYAATYTPDGQFGSGANAVKGQDALKKMISDLRQRAADADAKGGEKRPAMYHMLLNSELQFVDNDHAHMEAYWMTVFAQAGPNVPVRVAAAGREVDELVRVNGQWLIKTRDVAPKE
jgi:SnoaL-like domain